MEAFVHITITASLSVPKAEVRIIELMYYSYNSISLIPPRSSGSDVALTAAGDVLQSIATAGAAVTFSSPNFVVQSNDVAEGTQVTLGGFLGVFTDLKCVDLPNKEGRCQNLVLLFNYSQHTCTVSHFFSVIWCVLLSKQIAFFFVHFVSFFFFHLSCLINCMFSVLYLILQVVGTIDLSVASAGFVSVLEANAELFNIPPGLSLSSGERL